MADDFSGAKTLMRKVEAWRQATNMTSSTQLLHSFIVIMQNEGLGVRELADKCGIPLSSMSRHLLDLSDGNRVGPSFGLLQRERDPNDLRTVRYVLTPKGKLVSKTLNE